MKQYEAVIKIMEENGGFASLSYLYEKALSIPGVIWKTKTPFASIRRIVQDDRFFFKIKPGLWALKSYKNKLPPNILSLLKEENGMKKDELFSHSYYQGMIVELGNIKGFKTYIPPQDRNKNFLKKSLKDLVALNDILMFTYSDIVRKVKSIDVFWFNDRGFPKFVFEVEHSTDFKDSLLKFLELQDFNLYMYIISHDKKKEEFLSKIEFSAFNPIRERVHFISYEKLSQWHAKSYELMLLEKSIKRDKGIIT